MLAGLLAGLDSGAPPLLCEKVWATLGHHATLESTAELSRQSACDPFVFAMPFKY